MLLSKKCPSKYWWRLTCLPLQGCQLLQDPVPDPLKRCLKVSLRHHRFSEQQCLTVRSPTPKQEQSHGNWIVPTRNMDFFGPSYRTRTEMINLTTLWLRMLMYVYPLPLAPNLLLFKPKTHVGTPKDGLGQSPNSFICSPDVVVLIKSPYSVLHHYSLVDIFGQVTKPNLLVLQEPAPDSSIVRIMFLLQLEI
jgi:hypothetical protein